MSNNFPKVSPDGRWIVFVQNRNGLLMRPDSQLYIMPASGGAPRRMNCNLPRMNSWHSFSPNGKWMVFSSKGRSLYTQMFLTHIDENGDDSPPILIENATADNRAVNIPEFVNVPPDGLLKMGAPATDFYRLVDRASTLLEKGQLPEALAEWRNAVELDPEDGRAHYNLALTYDRMARAEDAIREYRRSIEISPTNDSAYTNLGTAIIGQGRLDEAIALFEKGLAVNPRNAKLEGNLGAALLEKGQTDDAITHLRRALEVEPDSTNTLGALGWALARKGQMEESTAIFRRAVELAPAAPDMQFSLARVLAAQGRFKEAVPPMEQSVLATKGQEPISVEFLAAMYSEVGRYQEALQMAQRALILANQLKNEALATRLRGEISRYEGLAAGKR
jgi:tetratricopeptide (TPR) repeat protein